jgi:hypothetical protein
MANEKRVRVNNAIGLLGAGLTNSGTTITFVSAPPFPTIDSTKHVAIILEPDTSLEEIVYLTAYTAGATTGTIARGQEGSTAVAHSTGMPWAHGPTKRDFAAGRLGFAKRTAGNLVVNATPGYRDTILADTPVAYWRLGENSGTTAADASGNAHPGTYTNVSGLTLGAASLIQDADPCLQLLTGGTGYVDCGNPAALQATTASVECWFKTSQTSGRVMLVAKPAAWRLQIFNGVIGFYGESSGDQNSTTNVADGNIHHVVATWINGSANTLKIYLDGTLVKTGVTTQSSQGNALNIGWDGASGGNLHLVGFIDEVSFYNYQLTQAQVTAHYNAGVTAAAAPWKAVDSSLDLVVPAFAGDIIEVGFDGIIESGDSFFDVVSLVGGSAVNWWSGGGGGNSDFGVSGWAQAAAVTRKTPSTVMRQVVAGDISSGAVTLRLMARPVANMTVDATVARPLNFWAKNHGPQEAA